MYIVQNTQGGSEELPKLLGEVHLPQTVGCTGMARPAMILVKPADPAQLIGEFHILQGINKSGKEPHLGYGKQRAAIPNPWYHNLIIDKNFECKISKAMKGNLPYQYETTEESIGIAQNMLNGHN